MAHCWKKGINELINNLCSVAEAVDMMDYRAYLCKLALIVYMTVTHSQREQARHATKKSCCSVR